MRYLILVGLLISPSLWADSIAHYQDRRNAYVGGSVMGLMQETDIGDFTPIGANVRLGGMLDEHWGLELRAGVAPFKDTWRAPSNSDKADVTADHVGALLVTGRLPFKSPLALPKVDNLFIQAFAGIANAQMKYDERNCVLTVCTNEVERDRETSFAWGVGAGLRTDFNVGLTLQYMHYIDADDWELSSLEGGLEWYF